MWLRDIYCRDLRGRRLEIHIYHKIRPASGDRAASWLWLCARPGPALGAALRALGGLGDRRRLSLSRLGPALVKPTAEHG